MKTIFSALLLTLALQVYAQSTISFQVSGLTPNLNEKVGVRGSIPPLSWERSIRLEKLGNSYISTVDFAESSKELEYKYVLYEDDENVTWESTPNRTLFLVPSDDAVRTDDKWNKEQVLDISRLQKIAAEDLMKDYELIETLVLDVHPGTYRYNTKEEIQAGLWELKQKFSQPLSHQEAYLAVSKIMASLQCDHTKAGYNNQTKIINSIIHYQADKLPFTFRWFGDEMIVVRNASKNSQLKRGTKIMSINSILVGEIKEKMYPYIGADGATDGNRTYKMEVNGYDFRYNAFDVFFPLLFPFKNGDITLEVKKSEDSEIEIIKTQPLTREKRFEILTERYPSFPKTRDDMWRFEILSAGVAKLTLNSFGLNGWKAMTIDYKAFLKDAFTQIDKEAIEHLIIDMRENNGGNDEMADELFSYLTNEPFQYEREGRTRYLIFPESLKPYIQTWGDNPWYYNLNPDSKQQKNGYYIFPESPEKPSKSKKNSYKGKSYLLTSSGNTSLAFYTAYRFKYQGLGKLIGQETGGNLNDINGGQILFLTLPNSQIEIDFPVMGAFSFGKNPNTGVLPDIQCSKNYEDFIDGVDLEMDAVLKLIAGQN